MWDEALVQTFASASEAVLPGSTQHGVHLRVIALFDAALPGYPFMVQGLLDAYAAEISQGSTFASLEDEQRSAIFRSMIEDPSHDIRDVVDGLFLFTLGQSFSEAHPDHAQVWKKIGYHGPSEGIAGWKREPSDV